MGKFNREGLTRRKFLTVSTAGIIAGLSGCGSPMQSFRELPPRPLTLAIKNYDGEPHTVYILIERDGEIVYWKKHDLKGSQNPYSNRENLEAKYIGLKEFARTDGRYAVNASFDDRSGWGRINLANLDTDFECVAVSVTIERTGKIEVNVPGGTPDCPS